MPTEHKPTDSTIYVPGPVLAHVCASGARQSGAFDGLLVFGGTGPEGLPGAVRERLMGHIRRGERIVLMTHSEAQMAWLKAQIALLTAPGGRA